jgi:4-hydroxy-tetrahydrodipicolinate reductase
MGGAVLRAALAADTLAVTGGWVMRGDAAEGADLGNLAGRPELGVAAASDLAVVLADADAVIDFTLPDGLATLLGACVERGLPLVTGTTGLAGGQQAAVETAARSIPIVQAANMSVGVTVLLELAARATAALGPGFDAEIVEAHHRHKLDAPSGTALAIGTAVAEARGGDVPTEVGRGPASPARQPGAIGYASIRAGDIVGEHTLLFAGAGERVELTHRAADRGAFAAGALRAAAWLLERPPGLYDMRDVLGLTGAPMDTPPSGQVES